MTAQIKADIAQILSEVNTLDEAIISFPNSGGTVEQAMAIHAHTTNLTGTINKGVVHANAIPPPSKEDSEIILNSLQALFNPISKTLNDLIARRAVVQALPIPFGGFAIPLLTRQNLDALALAAKAFQNALIAKAPADLIAPAQQLADRVNAEIAKAQNAYANV
ncbi:hypothetical protein L218DRAFT_1082430 [Marasmius fiardii PR-910]|nr:hypothetical protein L218DRAFT_1082430 [Marasmius fiardii PR-910]